MLVSAKVEGKGAKAMNGLAVMRRVWVKEVCKPLLADIPLFAGLSLEDQVAIEGKLRRKTYRRNTVVFEESNESSSLYILLEGKAKVFVSDRDGKLVVLKMMTPGAHAGELALLGASCCTVSVMTQEDSAFLVVNKQDFVAWMNMFPQLKLNVIRDLVEQVQKLTELVGTLALSDVYSRVVSVLYEMAEQEEGRLITGRLVQQDLAHMVGASREMVSRILRDLRNGGYIEIANKRILIRKKLPTGW